MNKKIVQIIVCCILLFSFPVQQSHAFIVYDPGNGALNKFKIVLDKIFHGISIAGQSMTNASLGLPGTGAATRAAIKTGKSACTSYDKTIKIADTADNFGSIEAIAGSSATIAKLSTKITALTSLRTCYELMLEAIEKGGTVAGVSGSQSLTELSGEDYVLTVNITSLNERLDKLRELKSEATKELWKGISVRLLAYSQQKIATKLMNEAINKYKISNYLDYGNALATQVYVVDYINKNVKDGKDQMILRSMLNNQAVGGKILPMVRTKTEDFLGFVPTDLKISDPDYYVKMAQVGSGEANPYFMQSVFQQQAEQTQASSDLLAKQEIANSNGFISLRDCHDVTTQQSRVESDNVRLSAEVRTNEEILAEIQRKSLDPTANVDPKALADAVKILNESKVRLKQYAENTQTNPQFSQACSWIENPGGNIANSLNSYLSSNLGAAATARPENLPFFASFLESTASNFLGNIIMNGKVNSNTLSEAGFRGANIASDSVLLGVNDADALKYSNQNNVGVTAMFTGTRNGGSNTFTLEYNAQIVPGANNVTITGPANFSRKITQPLSGQLAVAVPSTGGTYVMRVFDKDNKEIKNVIFIADADVKPGQVTIPKDGTASDAANQAELNGNTINTGPTDLPPTPNVPSTQTGDYPTDTGNSSGSNTYSYQAAQGKVAGASIFSKLPSNFRGLLGLQPRGDIE